jgi:hypothetical protein
MEIEGEELIHVSTGNRSIQTLREKAEVYDKAKSYFIGDLKKNIPIGIEVELLEGIGEDELKAFIERRQKDIALIGEEKKVARILALFPEHQEILKQNRSIYNRLEEDHKMLVLRDDSKLKDEEAGLLRVKKDSLGLQTEHVIDLASFIASVGKQQAKTDPKANELLRQVLRTLYESGEIPQELLEEMPLAKILDNPEGFLFPPIKTQDAMDIDSYLRAKKAIEIMA